MRSDLVLYILMHSQMDWQKLLGESADVTGFVGWIWKEVCDTSVSPQEWISLKVAEYKSH